MGVASQSSPGRRANTPLPPLLNALPAAVVDGEFKNISLSDYAGK